MFLGPQSAALSGSVRVRVAILARNALTRSMNNPQEGGGGSLVFYVCSYIGSLPWSRDKLTT